MRYPTRNMSVTLAKLMLGVAAVALSGACASGPRMDATDTPQAALIDRALEAAKTARQNGDLDTAAARLAYLASIAPYDEAVDAEYGKVLAELGRPDDAIGFFKRAKALKSDDWTIYNGEGVAYDEKHDYQAAQADYAKALELQPGEPAILNDDARSHMMAGDLKGAEALLAQTYPTDDRNAYLTDTQALLSAMEVTSNSNAPAEALTPDMAVKTPPEAPAPQPLTQKTSPAAAATVTPAASAAPVIEVAPAAPTPPPAKTSAQGQVKPAPVTAQVQAPAPIAVASAAPAPAAQVAAASETPATPASAPAAPQPVLRQSPAEPTVTSVAPIAQQAPGAPEAAVTPKAATAGVPAVVELNSNKPVVAQPAISADSPAKAAPAPAPDRTTPDQTAQPLTSAHAEKLVVVARAEPMVAAPQDIPLYSISVGAFAVKDNADLLTAKLAAHEAKAVPVVADDVTFWRVELGSLKSAEEARSALADVHALGYADARLVTSGPTALDAHVYIRVGTFSSHRHARHVAARLGMRDVHIARLTHDGRRYYRVWFPVGDRPDAELALADIRAKGFRRARIVLKPSAPRHLAEVPAATLVASRS